VTQEAGDQKEIKLLPIEQMEKMSHADLYLAREKAKTPEEQKHIAPYEHRAFAREYVEENPVSGAVGLAVAIPAYQAYKAVGSDSRTGVQGKQVTEGYKGIGEGLANAIKKPWERLWNDTSTTLPQQAPTGSQKPWEKYGSTPIPPAVGATPTVSDDERFNSTFTRLMKQESGTKHTDSKGNLITSPAGAQGITQVMPKTGASPGYGVTPIQNNTEQEYVRFGKDFLRAMLKEFDGDYEKALAAYNAGAGNVKAAIKKGGDNWMQHLPKPSETIPYVKNIMNEKGRK
jgi:hypothetical protein